MTKWSKLDTHWEGVSLDTLLAQVETAASYVIAFSDGGYSTNLPLDEVLNGQAWVVDTYEDQPLEPQHGGPARLLMPHLYFWKSAKWVRGLRLVEEPVIYDLSDGSPSFSQQPLEGHERVYSEATAQRLDSEVERLITQAHQQARSVLSEHREALDRLAQALQGASKPPSRRPVQEPSHPSE